MDFVSTRRAVAVAGLCLVAAVAARGSAQAQSWNIYEGRTSPQTIDYAGGAMSPTNPAKVYLTLPGGNATQFVMDTGSTGIIASSDIFKPGPNDRLVGSGSQTYTSSGIVQNGNFYVSDVVIHRDQNTPLATARVTVLQVTSETCLATARSCTPNPNPTGVAYMGVGFDRGSSSITPPAPYNNTNPFINIVSLASGQPISTLAPGYRVTNSGVTLGLSTDSTRDFAFVKLTPNTSPAGQPSPAWLTAPVTVTVGGATGTGTVLPDSGINYAFLTPPAGAVLDMATCPTPPGGAHCVVPASNTQLQVFLPGQITPQPASYNFTTGTTGNALQPDVVQVIPDGPAIFLNTGREFYAGFDYIYDPIGGYVGYRWNGTVSSAFGEVTPMAALIGDVSFQNGFTSSLPTYLRGATTFLQTGAGTISSAISGPGGLTIGSGQVTLSGVNTYTGGTTIAAGATLGVGANTAMGHDSGGLTLAGGTLMSLATFSSARAVTLGAGGGTFNTNGSNLTFSSGVSGAGGLVKAGAGTMTLTGANSYTGGTTVSGGTLTMATGASLAPTGALTITGGTFDLNNNNMTIGPLSGTGGTLALGSGRLTVDTGGTNTTLASVVTGTGGLVVQGGGQLSLTGANTFTGATAIASGKLTINGNHLSDVAIGGAGMLGGNGTITGNLVNAGTLAPGNSIGTFSVVGSLTHAAGSTYQVEANPQGQADRTNVSGAPGTATIAPGSSVSVVPQAGSYAPRTTYTILNATGGVAGTFSSVSTGLPFLKPSLSYDASNVFLTLDIGGFAAAAQTPTQAAVGAVLDATALNATGNYATVLGAMSTLSAQQGQAVMTAISGQNYAGFSTAGVQTAQLFMNNFASQVGGSGGRGANRVALAEACDVACDDAATANWGAWGGPIGGLGTIGAGAAVGGLTYNLGGFAAGLDRRLSPNLLLGVTAGFTTGQQWVSGFQGTGNSNTFQTGLYGSYTQSAFYLDGLAGYAYSDNTQTRVIAIPGLSSMTANGRTGANQFFGQLEGGYRFELGGAAAAFVTPFARLQGATATQNGFSESGAGAMSLTVASQTTNSLRSVLGAQLGGSMDMGWRDRLAMQLRLGWSHEYADTGRPVTAAFAGAPANPFTTYGIAPQRDGVVLGLAANTAVAEATSIYFRYEGDFSGQDSSHALTAGLRIVW